MIKNITILFVLLLTQIHIFANDAYPDPTLESPRSTMNYFLKVMKGYKLGDKKALDLATLALDLSDNEKIIKNNAKNYAQDLSETLDKIELIKYENIPNESEYSIWYYKKEALVIDEEKKEVEISIVKNKEDGKWRFSQQTLQSLATYLKYLSDQSLADDVTPKDRLIHKIVEKLPLWSKEEVFFLKHYQWAYMILTIFLAFIVNIVITIILSKKLVAFLTKKGIPMQHPKRILYPFGLFSFTYVFDFLILKIDLSRYTLNIISNITDVIMAVNFVLIFISLIEIAQILLERRAKLTANKFDDILVPLTSKTLKFFVWTFGAIYIGDVLGFNMKNILAGMGIGGIAFALAAKDTISNIFGSFTVLIDRPFAIGDWVVINESVSGTVEQVGLRSTRIRTMIDSLVTIPNGTLTNANIDNYGRRTYRRLITSLTVEYSTTIEQIEAMCEGVRKLIQEHPATRKEKFDVYFNNLGSSSLDIYISVYWNVKDFSDELKQKHILLVGIMKLASELNVSFAFPTQTLHLHKSESSSELAKL